MGNDKMLEGVNKFFSDKVIAHGGNHRGADYSTIERQLICFDQLTKILPAPSQPFSLNDYGCGYGALIPYLLERGYQFTYNGFDISEAMVAEAKRVYGDREGFTFTADVNDLPQADYTIAGGIFNVKLDAEETAWRQMILDTLHRMWGLSSKGMSFNILTSYSDADKMRPDLYYADPCFMFDYAKRNFSKEVALLHDYGVYEFTILVRKTLK